MGWLGVPAARIRQQMILEIQPKEVAIKACFTYCKPNRNIFISLKFGEFAASSGAWRTGKGETSAEARQ